MRARTPASPASYLKNGCALAHAPRLRFGPRPKKTSHAAFFEFGSGLGHVQLPPSRLFGRGVRPGCGSLRNKRPDLLGRPHCKGMAIGVARRGARRSGERTLHIPPSCSVPASHACGPHVASFVRRSSVRGLAKSACMRAARRAARGAICAAEALPCRGPHQRVSERGFGGF